MKIIPIKIEKAFKQKQEPKFIDWKLHNVCNNNCSYCSVENKSGSDYWFNIEKYKKYADKLIEISNGRPIWVNLTGGEPTLYPNFIELATYMHNAGIHISVLSNGSRTIRWWKELMDTKSIDSLILTFHSEQSSDYKHIANVANLFHDEAVDVKCYITQTKDTIPLSIEAFDYLVENTGALVLLKAMTIVNYDINSFFTESQLQRFTNNPIRIGKIPNKRKPNVSPIPVTLKVHYSDNRTKIESSQTLIRKQLNNFKDWICEVGKDNMNIDRNIVYRGSCRVGEIRYLDDSDLDFMTNDVICPKSACTCAIEVVATKYLPNNK